MIWMIAKREFVSNIITFRFLVGLIMCLALITASAFVLAKDYSTRLEIHDRNVRDHIRAREDIKVHCQIKISIDRAPSPLGFLCMGSDKELGNMVQGISYREVPREAVGAGSNNPLMGVFRSLDMVSIIQVVLSILALLLAYDAISGERERGTLAVTLSNPVPRHHVLLGKLLGGMLSIILPLMAGVLVGLLVVFASGLVILNSSAWVRIGLVFLCSLLYLSVIFMLGIMLSARSRRSATSLAVLLFVWVVLVMLLPNMAPYAAQHLRKVEDKTVVDANIAALEWELFEDKVKNIAFHLMGVGKYPVEHTSDMWRFMKGRVRHLNRPYPGELYYAPREHMIWYLEGIRRCIPVHLEYAGKKREVYRSYERQLRAQVTLSDNISRLSPAWAYYNAASILSGTDFSVYMRFMDQARRYRQELIAYSLSGKGFSSLSFFTRMKMGETLTYAEHADMESRQGRQAVDKLIESYEREFWDAPPLQGIPVFRCQAELLPESIGRALPDLLILTVLNIMFFLAAYASFMRQEVK